MDAAGESWKRGPLQPSAADDDAPWGTTHMGTTTAAISIDRFRRRRSAASAAAGTGAGAVQAAAAAPDALGTAQVAHPLAGTTLGTIERRYGLMRSEETIVIADVIATSGDLAVADRLAFIASLERHQPVVVIEFDGWYVACTTERLVGAAEVAQLIPGEGAPRIMSVASERGITPALGPLGA